VGISSTRRDQTVDQGGKQQQKDQSQEGGRGGCISHISGTTRVAEENTIKTTINFSLISSKSSRRFSKLTLYKLFKHSDPRTHMNNPGPKWGLTCKLGV